MAYSRNCGCSVASANRRKTSKAKRGRKVSKYDKWKREQKWNNDLPATRRRAAASRKRSAKGGTYVDPGGYVRKSSTGKSRKKAGKKAWPRKETRKMGHVVAGVEARVHEDVTKALKILKSAKCRSQATAKRAGKGKASGFSVLDKIVRELERLLTR